MCSAIFGINQVFSIKSDAPSRKARSRPPGPAKVVNINTCVSGASALIGRIASNPLCSPISISSKIMSGAASRESASKIAGGDENWRSHLKSASASKRFANKERNAALSSTIQMRAESDSRPLSKHAEVVKVVPARSQISLYLFIFFLSDNVWQAPCHFVDALVTFRQTSLRSPVKSQHEMRSQIYNNRTMNRSSCFILNWLEYSLHAALGAPAFRRQVFPFTSNISPPPMSGKRPLIATNVISIKYEENLSRSDGNAVRHHIDRECARRSGQAGQEKINRRAGNAEQG